jgi:hypothetical protein
MHRRRLDDRDDLPTSVLLRDYPFEMVRLACTRCGRRGQYRKSTLLARFGPDYGLVSMRLDLSEGLPEDTGTEHPRALRRVLPGLGWTMSRSTNRILLRALQALSVWRWGTRILLKTRLSWRP